MNYLVLEDEPLAAARVQEFACHLPPLKLAAAFDNAVAAMKYLLDNPVDLIFLDLHLGELSGIQFLEVVRPECAVIILTADPTHALKGFELHVAD